MESILIAFFIFVFFTLVIQTSSYSSVRTYDLDFAIATDLKRYNYSETYHRSKVIEMLLSVQ
jgi:hypothetical protein